MPDQAFSENLGILEIFYLYRPSYTLMRRYRRIRSAARNAAIPGRRIFGYAGKESLIPIRYE